MLAVTGQWEREAIGQRTAVAMRHLRDEGRYTGAAAPCGFALAIDGVRRVPVAEERTVITRARALRAVGASLRAVSASLADSGMLARSGRPFDPNAVANMIAETPVPA